MATSHVSLFDNSMPLDDVGLIQFTALLQIYNVSLEQHEFLDDYFSYLNSVVGCSGVGCISYDLYKHLVDPPLRHEFRKIVDNAIATMCHRPDTTVTNDLRSFTSYNPETELYRRETVLSVANGLLALFSDD
jgi:hypothetical protein